MSNQLPFYLRGRLEGEREHDRFGDVIVTGDINGDGLDEWIVSASTATYIEDEDGVNPQPHYYKGRVYVYSHDLQLLFTLDGGHYGDCFGAALALGDMNCDGVKEIIVGAPRASLESRLECGEVSVYSGRTAQKLHKWNGGEDYARLGSALAILDWDQDLIPDVAVSSHLLDPFGADRDGKVTIFSGRDKTVIWQMEGKDKEGLGMSLAAGDINGDGAAELIIGAPLYSEPGLTRNGRVLAAGHGTGLLYESKGKKNYDEHGTKVAAFDMDRDGTAELIIGSPKTGGEFIRGGSVAVYSVVKSKLLMEKEGWFGKQELGTVVTPYDRRGKEPAILTGSKAGSVYLLDMNGKLVHEFNGDESEVFGHSLSVVQDDEEGLIAVGAISAMNANRFMSGCVYWISPAAPAEAERDAPQSAEPPTLPAKSIYEEKKKILLATYWYLPHVGGVDVYVRLLKKELERRGHQVNVLAHHPDMAHYYLVDGDKKINKWKIKNIVYDKVIRFYQRYLSHVDPWVRYRDVERYCFELAAVLFDLDQYDIIHTQDIISTRALSRVKPPSTALVATIHGLLAKEHVIAGNIQSEDSLAWKYVADEEYYGSVSADATILPTNWLLREMARFAVPTEMFNVIPYGLDMDEFSKKSLMPLAEPAPLQASFTISCPARLVPVKGHRTLIGALKRLAADESWHCLLLGDGELRKDIEDLIGEYGLADRITLLGDRKDVPALLKKTDLMVLPSLQDNLPFSIMEAQLSGIPIVASDAGGIPEMISHEQTGLLFETGNEQQLAQQIARMMSDPALRLALAGRAMEWAKKQWSPESLLDRTLAVYDQALQKVNRS